MMAREPAASAERIPVAVLGATGIVGQNLVRMLQGHPWFRLAEVTASQRSRGRPYGEAVSWRTEGGLPEEAYGIPLTALGDPLESPVVLSALPATVADEVEPALARRGHLVSSNASALRARADVPLVVPEVNAASLSLLADQPWARAGGAVVTNPNCVVSGLAPVMKLLDDEWSIASGVIVTLQSLSGAGLDGPSALAMTGNVVPYIDGEEEKIGAELCKILGRYVPMDVAVNRVPVIHGHLAHLFLRFESPTILDRATTLLQGAGAADAGRLPTLPRNPIRVLLEDDRPQPSLDAGWQGGMGVTVGRVRSVACHDLALTVLAHNLVRGAAGACLANAELAVRWLGRHTIDRSMQTLHS
jgi:aspartate-semialdehyde dehydrogenase